MKGIRLPEDWTLPEDWKNWALAERPDLNPDKVAEEFKDYWIAKTGQNATKLNWCSTWRNWVRRQKQVQSVHRPQSHKIARPSRTTTEEWQQSRAIAQRYLEGLKRALKA